jgi:hypothetical protein
VQSWRRSWTGKEGEAGEIRYACEYYRIGPVMGVVAASVNDQVA